MYVPENRSNAEEALSHPFITRAYAADGRPPFCTEPESPAHTLDTAIPVQSHIGPNGISNSSSIIISQAHIGPAIAVTVKGKTRELRSKNAEINEGDTTDSCVSCQMHQSSNLNLQ